LELLSIHEVLAAHSGSLLALPGVVGTAIGRCGDEPCIRVFVTDSGEPARQAIPKSLGGYTVRVETSGRFEAR